MTRVAFLIPGDIDSPTGGYRYCREMLARLPASGIDVVHVRLPGTWPAPDTAAREATAALLAERPRGEILLIDGLAYGAFGTREIAAARGPVAALVHHPLAYETGLPKDRAEAFLASEREALRHAVAVVASSRETGRLLVERFGVDAGDLSVAVPGVETAPPAGGSSAGSPRHLVTLGAVSPRKGYDILIEALTRLSDLPWRATIAGSTSFAPDLSARLRARIANADLADRIAMPGALSEQDIARLFDKADLFVFPSRYEGYGMVVTEALARGVPVLTTTGVPAALDFSPPAVRCVQPGDAGALAEALGSLLDRPGRLDEARRAALSLRTGLPRWTDTAATIAAALKRIAS
jgi:glycosyltransferase involved in cell wall biosynthesis